MGKFRTLTLPPIAEKSAVDWLRQFSQMAIRLSSKVFLSMLMELRSRTAPDWTEMVGYK
jgi:hypothetical protein